MPRKESIRGMFDSIAPTYDRLNHLLSLGVDRLWRRRAIREIVDGSPQRILDLACGTGDFAIEEALAAGQGSRITGADISEGMMELVMRKAARAGVHDRITLRQADAEALPFADGSFHRVSCAFGVRNFEHREKALQECLRVLAPGGRLVVLELSIPENRFVSALYKLYFVHILPLIGGVVSGDRKAYRYLASSVQAFPRPARFCSMLSEAGFAKVRSRSLSFGICQMYIADKY